MADGTKIEWTDATWNIVNGCSVLSPGCTNCYAMKLAGTRLKYVESRKGLTVESKAGPVWNGITKFNEPVLLDPIRWKRPRKIFVCAHGDLFHDSVPDEWIDKVFAVMALAPQHQFQVLTKRSARMREYLSDPVVAGRLFGVSACLAMGKGSGLRWSETAHRLASQWPLSNVWVGVSVEDQQRADERIPDLLATPAAVRWLSAEPLLGMVDIRWALGGRLDIAAGILSRGQFSPGLETLRRLDWIVAGGESGPGARPMHPDWARWLQEQCARAGVAFHFKQWGNWAQAEGGIQPGDRMLMTWPEGTDGFIRQGVTMRNVGKKAAGRLLDGVEHNGYPS